MTPASIIADLRAYPWRSLLTGLVPPRFFRFMPAALQTTAPPIVPPASIAGNALTVVIAIMSFLACLTAGAVYMINRSAQAWVQDITSEITVELSPVNAADIDQKVTLVSLFLAKQKGVTEVKPISPEDSARLLEPWLGKSDAISALPVPRLIAVEIDRSDPPDLKAVGEALKANFDGVSLDDHRRWRSEIRTLTGSAAVLGLAVLMLVGAATVAVIVSATRSAMASNREIIEVLHYVGAQEHFISGEFERHFLGLGVRASLVGAVAAGLVFLVLPFLLGLLGGGGMAAAEANRLIGTGRLDLGGYFLFVLIIFVVAALCMMTSRLGVLRLLKSYA